ncbi:MAG: LysR substrate-binding domain-containing protein [Micrococcaceae bacterium]
MHSEKSNETPSIPFTFRQLEIFCVVVEQQSATAAAKQLHVAQSSVSASLAELERLVGRQLLMRKQARGTWPTAAGKQLYREATVLLHAGREMHGRLQERDGQIRGPLTIGLYRTLAPYIAPLLLTEFAQAHPNTNVTIVEGDQPELFDDLNAGNLDAAITYRTPTSSGIAGALVTARRPHVLLSAQHRFAQQEALTLQEIEEEPLVLLADTPSRDHTLELLGISLDSPRIALTATSMPLTRALVGHGLGVTILVQPDASSVTVDGMPVVEIPLKTNAAPTATHLYWRTSALERRPPRRVMTLLSFCRERLDVNRDP